MRARTTSCTAALVLYRNEVLYTSPYVPYDSWLSQGKRVNALHWPSSESTVSLKPLPCSWATLPLTHEAPGFASVETAAHSSSRVSAVAKHTWQTDQKHLAWHDTEIPSFKVFFEKATSHCKPCPSSSKHHLLERQMHAWHIQKGK